MMHAFDAERRSRRQQCCSWWNTDASRKTELRAPGPHSQRHIGRTYILGRLLLSKSLGRPAGLSSINARDWTSYRRTFSRW